MPNCERCGKDCNVPYRMQVEMKDGTKNLVYLCENCYKNTKSLGGWWFETVTKGPVREDINTSRGQYSLFKPKISNTWTSTAKILSAVIVVLSTIMGGVFAGALDDDIVVLGIFIGLIIGAIIGIFLMLIVEISENLINLLKTTNECFDIMRYNNKD